MPPENQLFPTLTADDCRRHIALARATPNSIKEQILNRLSKVSESTLLAQIKYKLPSKLLP
jgi:hypothetical protein